MHVTLTAYSILREKLPAGTDGRVVADLPAGATLGDLLNAFHLPGDAACSINGNIARDLQTPLKDGDAVAVFRPGAGGNI